MLRRPNGHAGAGADAHRVTAIPRPAIERITTMQDVIVVTGNLTAAPEPRTTSSGAAMTTFTVASTERRLDGGRWIDVHTNFYRVSTHRKLAEHALASLTKGQRVIVAGRLRLKEWEANGRSGVSADLDATAVGPDLLFGTTTFEKDAEMSGAAQSGGVHPSHSESTGWAAPGSSPAPTAGTSGDPAGDGTGVRDGAGALVGAAAGVGEGGWDAPDGSDTTPF